MSLEVSPALPNPEVRNYPPAPMPVEHRSSTETLVAALRKVERLNGLSDAEYTWLAENGTEYKLEAGTVMFHEGEPVHAMTIMLHGEIHVRRTAGLNALFIGRSGEITGLLPFSRMKTYGGDGITASAAWGLQFNKSMFPELLRQIPPFGQIAVGVLLDRVREVTRIEQQSEKLAALNKLAGNLSHELNNPASAAQRSASSLFSELRTYGQEKFRLGQLCLDESTYARLREWSIAARQQQSNCDPINPIAQSDCEEAIAAWLGAHSVNEPWLIAPALAECGVTPLQLDELASFLSPNALGIAVSQFASSQRAERMTEAVLDSTARIFDLIRAIKDYSYLDQAPIQEVDVAAGLDATLGIMQSRLERIHLVREYEPDLPRISAWGSELNQVWTALIENALDAIQKRGPAPIGTAKDGTLRLITHAAGDMVLIEVWDDGPGVPPELRTRIFEPFFTTKAPGHGLGLGLDAVNRIVSKHRGFINVESKPGATCFQIRLPIRQAGAY